MKGTVVVVLHKDGHLMGSGVCTEQRGDDGQEMIARNEAWGDAIANCCHPDMARAVNSSRVTQAHVAGVLHAQCGWKEHTRRFEILEA